jgi:hypothetical protein
MKASSRKKSKKGSNKITEENYDEINERNHRKPKNYKES